MNFKWMTNVKVVVKDLDGNILEIKELHNLIPTISLNKVRDFWYGTITDGKIRSMAVGRDNTVPALTDTALGQETFRKAITTYTLPGDAQLKSMTYISPNEAVGLIEEIGWFVNFAADDFLLAETGDAVLMETGDHLILDGAGVLFSRVLYNKTKTDLESLQVERTDTIREA